MTKRVLWWGRSDPAYSRNRIIRRLLQSLDWTLIDFYPAPGWLADWQVLRHVLPVVDLVWVPCFRQRDVAAASRWAKRQGIPLVFDPLISAYDKQIGERKKFAPNSGPARRLLAKERKQFQRADYVLADTQSHAEFYQTVLQVPKSKIQVLPVGADEQVFTFRPWHTAADAPLTVLFFGSFLALQGPEIIAAAIRQYRGPAVNWRFIGRGPLLSFVKDQLHGRENVTFSDWVSMTQLAEAIAEADICLGIFGQTEKTLRVMPNKFFQAIASGRPVITCASNAYPAALRQQAHAGIFWVPAGNAKALADTVHMLAAQRERLPEAGLAAYQSYQTWFSESVLRAQLASALAWMSEV